ncbi:MAG: methyl-accepting chemotaxis protein [Pseudomonadota bacterium]
MNILRSFGIGARLVVVFLVLIALLVVVGGSGALNASRLADELDASARTDLTRIDAAGALGRNAGIVARASREMLLLDAAGPLKKQRALLAKALHDSQQELARLQALGRDAHTDAPLAKVVQAHAQFAQAVAHYLEKLDSGNPDDAREALLIQLRPVQAGYEQALQGLGGAVLERAQARAADGRRSARQGIAWLLGLAAAGTVLALLAAGAITASVVQPLRRATEAAHRIEQGDLARDIADGGRDEVGQLLQAMQRMQAHLRHVIHDVHRAAHDVSTSSDEIASGNADLSHRTERASSHLQQTASAMEQISATVAGSSAKSHQAAEVAARARNAVVAGGESVDTLVDTMNRIAEASARIKDITSVIDGIAFQTNILALNAAVEAARAGEQGRGFAVVAGEVRSLAARAGDAAKEIKVLIDDSAGKVSAGTATVAEVGERIRGIVAEVVDVRQLIEEVSVASRQQETGIGAVNGSVADLDRATQQNAALVEQLAATTDSLKANARRLVETVQFFRIPSGAAA